MAMNKANSKGILLEAGTNEVEFLLLQLGTQRYGVNVSKVCQILIFDPLKITPVPEQKPSLLGLMTFRRETISVIDLRKYLNLETATPTGNPELVLVTEFNGRVTGFVIDAVDRIERCTWQQFEPITNTVCDKSTSSSVGTVTLKDGIVIILDLETILGGIDPAMSIAHYKDQIKASTTDRTKISIVYCEDSQIVQRMLVKSLADSGFSNIRTFNTGKEGLEYLERHNPNDVDIILSDIEMPKMDGLTLCKRVKELPGFKETPFVFFSSTITDQMQIKCKSVGGNACFSKPQLHLIVDAIEKLIQQKEQT